MQPNEFVSQNIGPPWTPKVWSVGPDALIKEAQADLFYCRNEIEQGALGGTDTAMAGQPGRENEQEGYLSSTSPNPDMSPRWSSMMMGLKDTHPRLAGWSEGDKTGPANPNV